MPGRCPARRSPLPRRHALDDLREGLRGGGAGRRSGGGSGRVLSPPREPERAGPRVARRGAGGGRRRGLLLLRDGGAARDRLLPLPLRRPGRREPGRLRRDDGHAARGRPPVRDRGAPLRPVRSPLPRLRGRGRGPAPPRRDADESPGPRGRPPRDRLRGEEGGGDPLRRRDLLSSSVPATPRFRRRPRHAQPDEVPGRPLRRPRRDRLRPSRPPRADRGVSPPDGGDPRARHRLARPALPRNPRASSPGRLPDGGAPRDLPRGPAAPGRTRPRRPPPEPSGPPRPRGRPPADEGLRRRPLLRGRRRPRRREGGLRSLPPDPPGRLPRRDRDPRLAPGPHVPRPLESRGARPRRDLRRPDPDLRRPRARRGARGGPRRRPRGLKVFLTGGTGFVGSALLRALLARGDEVTALRRARSRIARLADLPVNWVGAAITDEDALAKAAAGAEAVFHVAADLSYSRRDRRRQFEANVRGTRAVAAAALRAGARRLVHTSSVAAVGIPEGPFLFDETSPYNASPLDIGYFETKREAEV